MLVTQVCGHSRILQGCRFPSRKFCLVSQMWMPPRGVFGRVLAGTRARQYRPTWWILSMACKENGLLFNDSKVYMVIVNFLPIKAATINTM